MTEEIYVKAFQLSQRIKDLKRNLLFIEAAIKDEENVSDNGNYKGQYGEIGKLTFMMNDINISSNNIKAILNAVRNLEFNNIIELEKQFKML